MCQSNLVDPEGLVIQSSSAKTPTFTFAHGESVTAKAQIFDCIGNGVTGDITITNTVIKADKSSRTGKWSAASASYGAGALKCSGKCTASFSTKGSFDVVVGTGSATVSVGTKNLATISDSKTAKLRVGARVDVGPTKKVLRITGSNLVLIALTSVSASFTNQQDLDRLPAVTDTSLTDEKQIALSKFGFNAADFSQEWSVLPMERGTTTDDPTLDLCNAKYPSDADRIERRQVIATKAYMNGRSEFFKGLCLFNLGKKQEACLYLKIASSKNYPGAMGLVST